MSILDPPEDLPIAPQDTLAPGIFPGDVIIRTGIIESLNELRANPWLLDYCFASLPQDELTAKQYGQKSSDAAKKWFARTNIPVVWDVRQDTFEPNCISISLVESTQTATQLADVNLGDTNEDVESTWPVLAGPFSVEEYDSATKTLKVPVSVTDDLILAPTMVVLDDNGYEHRIESVHNYQYIVLTDNIVANFNRAFIKSAQPKYVASLESCAFREVVRVGVHTIGDPQTLLWLHAITVFLLKMFNEKYFEQRQFEQMTISSGPFSANTSTGRDNCWIRSITVTGTVRNFWPKSITDRTLSVENGEFRYSAVGQETDDFIPEDNFYEGDTPWYAARPNLSKTGEENEE